MAQDPEQAYPHPKQGQSPWMDRPPVFFQQPLSAEANKDGQVHGTCQAAAWDNCIQAAVNSKHRMKCDTWQQIYGNPAAFIEWAKSIGYIVLRTIPEQQVAYNDEMSQNYRNKVKDLIKEQVKDKHFKCIEFSIKLGHRMKHRVVMYKDGNGQWWYIDSGLFPNHGDTIHLYQQKIDDKEWLHVPYTGKVPEFFWNTIIDSDYYNGGVFIVKEQEEEEANNQQPNNQQAKPKPQSQKKARANDYGEILFNEYYDGNGYNQYHQRQKQQSAQLLLSPPQQQQPQLAILPVQYGLNNNNNDNGDYIYSQQWLYVLVPILLIASCLFGIICMILMGFGGLFCYREGKKARVINERGGFYRKLSQKDDIDVNKRDRGLVHYDESV